MIGSYVPTRLNATDYPGLVPAGAPVDTVAIGTGLFVGPVAADSDEYRKLANVVDAFFAQFQTLLGPGHHGKWAEVNLSSEIPGWHRFPPADDWLKRNASIVAGQDLRAIFMRFLDERQKATGGPQMSQEQKDVCSVSSGGGRPARRIESHGLIWKRSPSPVIARSVATKQSPARWAADLPGGRLLPGQARPLRSSQ